MTGKRYDLFDHTADIGIMAYGEDFWEALENVAYAMFSIMVDLKTVKEVICRIIEVEGEGEELVVNWLNELLYLFDAEGVVFCRFEVKEMGGDKMKALVVGEKLNSKRHELKIGVKAATYHQLAVMKEEKGYKVRVILDV
jgi:SHS2 domain-containing protein